jgi:RHS repeat-associated protein
MHSADFHHRVTLTAYTRFLARFAAISRTPRRLILAVILIAAGQLIASAQTASPNVQFNQKSVDFGDRDGLRVNPNTLALELQIPLGNYPGRAGLNLPVTISYSSKLWRVDFYSYIPGPFGSNGNPIGQGYTRVQARYAEHSSAGWTSSLGFPFFDNTPIQYYDINGTPKPDSNSCGSSGCYVVDRQLVWMPDGSSHELRSSDQPRALNDTTPLPDDLYAVDGTRIRYQRSTQTLFMPDGGRYLFATGQYVDRNGNTLTAANNSWVDTLGRGIGLPPLTSTPGTNTYALRGVGGADINYTFIWKNLGDAGVLTNAQPLQYVADSGCPVGIGSFSPRLFQSDPIGSRTCIQNAGSIFNPVVLYQIQLPTGQSYTLTYNVYGEIDKVQLPTGGYERYQYAQIPSLNSMSSPYTQANRGVVDRYVSSDGTAASEVHWHYSGSPVGTISTTAPDNTLTERRLHYDVALAGSAPWSYTPDGARDGMAYDERAYSTPDSGGVRKMLRRTLTEWSMTGSNAVGLAGVGNANRNPRVTKLAEILFDPISNSALAKTTVYGYDTTYEFSTGVNPTSVSEYDYVSVDQNTAQTGAIGSIPMPPQPVRITETAYLDSNSNYRLKNILGLPTSVTIKKDAATVVAQLLTSYDESAYQLGNTYGAVPQWASPTGVRGNATTMSRWLDTAGSYVQTHAQYDQCGSVVGSWDANGNRTQIDYSSTNAYAYPTSVTTPAPNPDAVSYTSGGTTYNFQAGAFGSTTGLTTYTSYDPYTGRVTSTTDANGTANGKATTFDYNDPLNRLKLVKRPDDGTTTYIYDRSMNAGVMNDYVRTLTSLDASRTTESYQFFDGLGRPTRSFTNEGGSPVAFLTVDTQYDSLGRVYRSSNPYRTGGSGDDINPSGRWTTIAYDDLGRVMSATTPDGAAVTTSHVLNTVTVTDQAGKKRSSVSDALGRLTQITEDPTSGGLNYVTNYTYDTLGNLRKVDQGGQLRFFMYDSLSRLIRAKNPEQAVGSVVSNMTDTVTNNAQWSIAYGYDSNGNMTARVDARNVTTNYVYDHLSRNIITFYTPPVGSGVASTPDIRRYYDNPTFNANGLGRLYSSQSVGVAASVFDSYDQMGRPTQYHQAFWVNNAWGQPYNVGRAYDKAGHVTSQTYPSGRTVSYGYDSAGRISSFNGNLGDGLSRTYSTGVTYDELGGIRQEQFGTATPLYHKLHYNVRGQLYDTRLSSVAWATDQWDWNRGALVNCYSTSDLTASDTSRALSGANNNGNLRRAYAFVPLDASGSYGSGGNSSYAYYQDDYDYDALNRLSYVAETSGASGVAPTTPFKQTYTYDRFGNRTIKQSETFGVASTQFELQPQTNQEVSEPSNRLYAPGDSGRAPSQKLMRYDSAGNQVYDSYTGHGSRIYDAENRMTQAQDTLQNWATYTYDADGRRVKRLSAGQETWQVYGMGGELLAEYRSGSTPMTATKEYGYRGGELLVTMSSGDDQRLKRFVTNLYYGALQRDPTPQELQDASNQLAAAGAQSKSQLLGTAKQVARALFTQTSYENAPYKSDPQYVADLYYAYMQRAADNSGLGWWVSQLSKGRSGVCDDFQNSPEFDVLVTTLYGNAASDDERTDHFINNLYLGANGEFAPPAQLQLRRGQLNVAAAQNQDAVKSQAETIAREVFASQVTDLSIPAQQFVTNLYEGFLQRGPDATGLSFWTAQAGTTAASRQGVLDAFATCSPFRELSGALYREAFWLVPDHLGTPRMVVDKSGSLAGIKRHDYLPFGEDVGADVGVRTTGQGYSVADNINNRFTGQLRDDETGLDYFIARYYSSRQGRFTSPDSFGGRIVNPQSLNLYAYVLNNPLRLVDPTGHWFQDPQQPKQPPPGKDEDGRDVYNVAPGDEGSDENPVKIDAKKSTLFELGLMVLREGIHNGLDPHFVDRKVYGISESTIQYYEEQKHHTTMALMPLAFAAGPEFAAEDAAAEMSAAATGEIDAILEEGSTAVEELPSIIYREGTPSPSNLTPRAVDNGNLSFRDSISNPYPLAPGQRPVFRPGEPYFGVNTSKLPSGSIINDQIPPGHVSVRGAPADTIKQAVTGRWKFPK